MYVLLLDNVNEESMYFSSTAQTGKVCTSPRPRKQGMCVLLLNYANDKAKKVPYKQQNGRLSPAALQVRDADEGLLGIL
jgi:hypothetical protein